MKRKNNYAALTVLILLLMFASFYTGQTVGIEKGSGYKSCIRKWGGVKVARIYGEIKSERSEKHQIANEWIESSINITDGGKGSIEIINSYLTLDEDNKETLVISIKKGCNYVIEECESGEDKRGRYNFYPLRTKQSN